MQRRQTRKQILLYVWMRALLLYWMCDGYGCAEDTWWVGKPTPLRRRNLQKTPWRFWYQKFKPGKRVDVKIWKVEFGECYSEHGWHGLVPDSKLWVDCAYWQRQKPRPMLILRPNILLGLQGAKPPLQEVQEAQAWLTGVNQWRFEFDCEE